MISRRKKMKKNAVVPIALAALILLGASGGKKDGSVTYTETVHGYNGDMVVEVDITGKKQLTRSVSFPTTSRRPSKSVRFR